MKHIDALVKILKKYDKNCYYSMLTDTIYSDFNNTFTTCDTVKTVMRYIDSELVNPTRNILRRKIGRTEMVTQVHELLKGRTEKEIKEASMEAAKYCKIRDEIIKMLPRTYNTRLAIFTGLNQISADILVNELVCSLYYQNVSDSKKGGNIAVVGSLHDAIDGVLTGKTIAVPDDNDRVVLREIDMQAYFTVSKTDVNELMSRTEYPCSPIGLDYKF